MNSIRRGDIIVVDNDKVLIEYSQNRFLRFTKEATATIIEKFGSGGSLLGVYETIGGIVFEIDKNGKRVTSSEISAI